jgi:hypothetical protein
MYSSLVEAEAVLIAQQQASAVEEAVQAVTYQPLPTFLLAAIPSRLVRVALARITATQTAAWARMAVHQN